MALSTTVQNNLLKSTGFWNFLSEFTAVFGATTKVYIDHPGRGKSIRSNN